jgi:hypothetical protein
MTTTGMIYICLGGFVVVVRSSPSKKIDPSNRIHDLVLYVLPLVERSGAYAPKSTRLQLLNHASLVIYQ